MADKTFVGRKQYSNIFNRMLEAPEDSPYILNLHGPGGIGKTKILQEFVKICDEGGIPHTSIIDLYDVEMSSRISAVEMKIAKKVKGSMEHHDPFQEYWDAREKHKEDPLRGIIFKKTFINGLSAWANKVAKTGKRGVLIFDTFEMVRYSLVGDRLLNDWLPELKSAVVVLSGRNDPSEIKFPEDITDKVEHALVEDFSESEAVEYLKERRVWEAVQEEGIADRLFDLTQKKPLLLALSTDWMMEHDFFPVMRLADLVEGLDQDAFEHKLVERLPLLAGERTSDEIPPERLILPIMAHLFEPLDEKILDFLDLYLDPEEPRKVLKNLSETSFVKGMSVDGSEVYWFQDELRSLFHKHIFKGEQEETWGDFRKNISEQMIRYYDQICESSTTDPLGKERAEASKLYHEICLNPDDGMKIFQEKFQGARENFRYGFSSLFLSSVRFSVLFDDLPEQHLFHFKIQEGRWLRDMGAVKQARERFEELLDANANDAERTPYIYNALGATASRMGEYDKALRCHQKSLSLSKAHRIEKRLFIEERCIGEVYLLKGDWEQAVQSFKRAYEAVLNNLPPTASEEEKQEAGKDLAGILEKLGHAYGVFKDTKTGLNYIDQAIDLFTRLAAPRLAAQARIIRCDILRRRGEYENIVEDIAKAIAEFEELDHKNRAQGFFYLGYAQWYRADAIKDQTLREKALISFEKCIEIARQFEIYRELLRALHEASQIYWDLGEKEKAREANDEAYKLACQFSDIYYAVNSLVKKAEFDFEENKFKSIHDHANELKEKFEENYNFPVFFGRMYRILGDVAYEEKNYDKAFDEYAKAFPLITEHGGYGRYTIEEELKRLEEKIMKLPLAEQRSRCSALRRHWQNTETGRKFHELIEAFIVEHTNRLIFE